MSQSERSLSRGTKHSRLLIALLTACFIGIAGALSWYYARQRVAVEQAAIREMSAIGDIETAQIDNWRHERLDDGGVLMRLPEMQAAERLLAGTPRPGDGNQVRTLMAAYQAEYGYNDICLVDQQGEIPIRLLDGLPEARIQKEQRAELARNTHEPALSDIYLDRTGERLITLTVPVGRVGAMILEIDPKRFLDPYLKAWRSFTRTGETYLARRDPDEVVYLTELRHGDHRPFRRRLMTGSRLPQERNMPERFVLPGPDYRGVQVLLWGRRVPGSRWFLLVKIDRAEVAESLTRLSRELMVAIGLIALEFIAGIGWIWRGHQLRMRGESEERLASKLVEITTKEAEIRTLSTRLINAQEEERRRLSRELHDDLSQQIAAVSIGIGSLKRLAPREATTVGMQFDSMQQGLIDLSESVRRISHELHPSILRHAGLASALRSYCREFEQLTGMRVSLRIEGEFAGIHPDVGLTLYRIVQETLRNVAKHAQVTEAEVELSHGTGGIRLSVRDRGVGISSSSSLKAGLGLLSIRERTRLVGGTVDITSPPDGGTHVLVRIPDEPALAMAQS